MVIIKEWYKLGNAFFEIHFSVIKSKKKNKIKIPVHHL